MLETPGFRFKGADLSVNSNDISISKSDGIAPGESLEVRANIYNLGMDPGKEVAVALVMSLPGGTNPVEVARITVPEVPLYGPTPVKFPWIAVPGEHALRVVIDPDKKLEENSRFNNEALITVKVPGKDTPPKLEIRSPDQGQKFSKPKVQLDASGIDESGISLMEYRIDGGLWTQRQGSDRLSEEVTIQPGDHTIFFRATDVSGNQITESRTISVTFDKPVLILLEPADGAIIDQNIVTAKIELGDPAKIACVEARTGGGAWRDIPIAGEKASSFKIPAEFGRQSLEVKAVDVNGVEASISRSIDVTSQADEPIQQMPQKSPEQVPEGTPREEIPGGILFEGLNWTVVDDPSPSEPSKWVVKDDKLQQLSNIFRTDREYEFWQGTHIFAGSDSSTDYELSFDISSSDDDGIGAIVRYQDRNNYYRFILVQDSANRGPFRRLEKFEKGQRTLLAEDKNGYTPGQIYHFEFKAIEDALEVWMDGIKILSARDSSFGSGKAGFVAYASPGLSIWNIKINDSV